MADLRRTAATLAAVAILMTGCGGEERSESAAAVTGVPADAVEDLPADLLPSQILGLGVGTESVEGALATDDRTYFEALSLYSLRQDELVQATVQVGRLVDDREYLTEAFREDLVYKLAGGAAPAELRIGDTTVWLTRGTKQSLAIWFSGRYQLVLAVRDDFKRPRALLRAAVGVQL